MNYFLNHPAISVAKYEDFLQGMSQLMEIEKQSDEKFLKHHSLYGLPILLHLYSNYGQQSELAIGKFIEQLTTFDEYLDQDDLFDLCFPNTCNGYLGIDFTPTAISNNRRITCSATYETFRGNCGQNIQINNITDFWNNRKLLFPKLVFCNTVLQQIQHLSLNDPRFKQIEIKLKILDDFAKRWTKGPFNFKELGLNNSPDTPTRKKNTEQQRTINCPIIGNRIFDLHIKWYVGNEAFRLYYYPHDLTFEVYVGYIGDKEGIGF